MSQLAANSLGCIWYSEQCYILARVREVEANENRFRIHLAYLTSANSCDVQTIEQGKNGAAVLKFAESPEEASHSIYWCKSSSHSPEALPEFEITEEKVAPAGWTTDLASLQDNAEGYIWRLDVLSSEERFGPYLWSYPTIPSLDLTEKIANEMGLFFSDPENVADAQELVRLGVTWHVESSESIDEVELPLEGETWVITGKFEGVTRDELKAQLISLGAKVGSAVSKNTHYLVAGEKAGSKLIKAKELNIPVLTEADLSERIGSS